MSGMPGILTSETTKKKLLGAEVPEVLFSYFSCILKMEDRVSTGGLF